jgi:two-component system response regulator FixJ
MPSDSIVHVIDDDDDVRQSLDFLFRSAELQTKTYPTALDFLKELPSGGSGCIITDVKMPGMNGIELLRRLKEREIGLPVIVITGHGDVPLAVEAMKHGAMDFLEKPFDDEVLIASVKAALQSRNTAVKHAAEKAELQRRMAALSNREREVMEGLVAGKPNKMIAYDLGISPRTVEIYRANVMTKMQAVSLSMLVRMAMIADFPTVTGRNNE